MSWRMLLTKQLIVAIAFYSMEVNGYQQLFG